MKLIIGNLDVSQFYNNISIHGDDNSCGRSAEFGVVVSSTDKNLPKLSLKQGDTVEIFTDKGKKVFSGILRYKEKSVKGNMMTIKALERLVDANLSKGSFNFLAENPASIAQKVFESCGLKVGKCESATPVTRTFDGDTLYDIVYTSYYLDYEQTGKPYIIRMNYGSDSVEVVEKGKIVAKYELNAKENLLDAKYSETSENVVNKVKIFDEDGNLIGDVSGDGIDGVDVTEIYKQEKDEDAGSRAKAMLKGIEKLASVSTLGDWELITGNAVTIKESFTGLNGKFFIKSDTHKIENGVHTVDLELAFENIMEEKTSGDLPEAENSFGGGFKGSTTEETIWNFFRSRGYNDGAIAGIIGNLKHESGLDPATIQGNGKGPGHGLAQWEGPRLTALKNFANQRGSSWNDLQTQLLFIEKEMNEMGGWNNTYKKIKDPGQAAQSFEKNFERAGVPMMSKRIAHAKNAFANKPSKDGGRRGRGIGSRAINIGKRVIGSRYLWGGNTPSSGIDCSGFVQWSYRQAGANIPGRLTSEALMRNPGQFGFKEIPFNQRQPGDVLYHPGHVAMQYTNGKIIESGGWSKGTMGYSGVAITPGKGRTFNRAFRYVGR